MMADKDFCWFTTLNIKSKCFKYQNIELKLFGSRMQNLPVNCIYTLNYMHYMHPFASMPWERERYGEREREREREGGQRDRERERVIFIMAFYNNPVENRPFVSILNLHFSTFEILPNISTTRKGIITALYTIKTIPYNVVKKLQVNEFSTW